MGRVGTRLGYRYRNTVLLIALTTLAATDLTSARERASLPGARPAAGGDVSRTGDALDLMTKARTTLEEMQVLGHAIRRYAERQNQLPAQLDDLAPEILDTPITHDPFGHPYAYAPVSPTWHLSARLPLGFEIAMTGENFTRIPLGILSIGEAERWNRIILRRLANALDSYGVDYNAYPRNVSELVPVYIDEVPSDDAYENCIRIELTSATYTLTSLGRDGLRGGSGPNADLIVTSGGVDDTRPTDVSLREYMWQTSASLRMASTAVQSFVVDWNQLPSSLAETAPIYIVRIPPDACGVPLQYEITPDGRSYTIRANGFPCGPAPEYPLWIHGRVDAAECGDGLVGGVVIPTDLID